MGLDALVFCNCFERGKLLEPPPHPKLVFVSENGGLDCKSKDPRILETFDNWLATRACKHEEGVVAGCFIGNSTYVDNLGNALRPYSDKFPILLGKVLYSGTHTGDFIAADQVKLLRRELSFLRSVRCQDPTLKGSLRILSKKLEELAHAAIRLKKPIAF